MNHLKICDDISKLEKYLLPSTDKLVNYFINLYLKDHSLIHPFLNSFFLLLNLSVCSVNGECECGSCRAWRHRQAHTLSPRTPLQTDWGCVAGVLIGEQVNDYAALLNTRIKRQGSGPGRVPSRWKAI